MQKTSKAEALRKSIMLLEQRQIEEERLLREQLSITYESIKPVNVLRNIIQEIASPPNLKDNLIQTATGLITGYISRKVVVGASRNPLIRLGGLLVQYGVTNFVSNHSDLIKTFGSYFQKKVIVPLRSTKS